MRRVYSKQLGAFIIDETDSCHIAPSWPQMGYHYYQQPQMAGGSAQLGYYGDVRYFPGSMGSSAQLGNVRMFSTMGSSPQMGAFDARAAISDAVKKVLPGATQSVVNDFLKSEDGKRLATKVETTAYAVGAEAAKAQAASQMAEMQQTLEAKYRAGIEALQRNWKTIAMIGGGALVLGLAFYLLKGKKSPAMANPRRCK